MSLDFKFKFQAILAQVDAPDGFLRRFASESRKAPPGALLRWQAGAGISGPVTLKSGSGQTQFIANGDLIQGQTRYFTSDFEAPEGWQTRASYSRDRLRAVLQMAEDAGAAPKMLSVTHIAACRLPPDKWQVARKRLVEHLGFLNFTGDKSSPYDFTIRAGYPVSEDCFLVTQIAWYQARTFTMVARPGETVTLRDWEGHVDEEGVELRFDYNNKHALFKGRVDWPANKLVDAVHEAQGTIVAEYARVQEFLSRATLDS